MAEAIKHPPARNTTKKPAPIVLQERDRKVLYYVFLHRFMTATQVRRAVDPSWDAFNCQKRLKALVDHKYLNLPPAQKGRFVPGGGKNPHIYALGNGGAQVLTEPPYSIARKRVDWTSKNREVGRPNLEHTLMITEVVTRAHAAARTHGFRFLDETDIIASMEAPERVIPRGQGRRGWPVPGSEPNTMSRLIPDRMFAIEDPARPAGQNRRYFFLEADRGNESQVSRDPKRPTIARKMIGYRATARQKLLSAHFPGIGSFTVLFVATGAQRAQNMHSVNLTQGNGWNRFWFIDEATLIANDDFFGVSWKEGKSGSPVQIAAMLED